MIQYNEEAAKRVNEHAVRARQTYMNNERRFDTQSYYDALDNLTNDLFHWEYEFYWLCKDDKLDEAKRYVKDFIDDINKIHNRFNLPTMANGLNANSPLAVLDTELSFARMNLSKLLPE